MRFSRICRYYVDAKTMNDDYGRSESQYKLKGLKGDDTNPY